jgi:hypothetical protein
MRALETEVSRLREAYTNEISDANVALQQHKEMLHTVRNENEVLKEILAAHGINYAPELEQRMAERGSLAGFQSSPIAASSTVSNTAAFTNATSNHNITPATSISTGLSPQATGGVDHPDVSPPTGFVPQQQVYHASPSENMAMDRSACQVVDTPVPTMRGVFESDPQLQIDFILTYAVSQISKFLIASKNLSDPHSLHLQTRRPLPRTYRLPLPPFHHRSRRRGHALLRPRPDGHLPTT